MQASAKKRRWHEHKLVLGAPLKLGLVTPLKLSLGAHDWRGQDYVHLQQGTELGAGMW